MIRLVKPHLVGQTDTETRYLAHCRNIALILAGETGFMEQMSEYLIRQYVEITGASVHPEKTEHLEP